MLNPDWEDALQDLDVEEPAQWSRTPMEIVRRQDRADIWNDESWGG
jgi:hypothetical protein